MWFQDALTRLKAQVTGMREIDGASSLDAAMRGAVATPSLYLIPLTETGRELPHTGPVDQLITVLFGVLFVLDTARSGQGMDVLIELEAKRRQVRHALVGWVPEEETGEPVTFAGGELVQFQGDGRLWWSDEFLLTTYYRSNP
ncbi:MAG: hypothetical protein KKB95_09420 [Gammaproteobacteria bacterium]|nr:hypothetical protein [Gammaproteobacteria bacterium]MBU1505780.1 hypothetical protein [Gammaproteobacteria bacterium]MBU2119468.1 hypothetical protein [Gammaproteobacteria bacterium]MBU2172626.1 hypothetical protein [Gammaproteobacteria bacterium]MBU2202084.1 hypothetical protein [Gammaproteobacteria bacterium]